MNELYYEDLKKHILEKINIKDGDAEINTTSNGTLSYSSAPERNISYSYLIPLKGSENTNGALFIENSAPFKYNREMFLLIVETINIVVQNLKANDKILDLAMKDQLTQVYNRNYMQKHIKEKISRGEKFSLVLGDIDFFKKINDTYGHLAGDEVLKSISKILKNNLSKEDRIYRYGGEEFLIYLEGMTEIESFALVSKIKNDIEAATIVSDDITLKVTMSFGCYETVSGESMKAAIEKADEALYYSKENGRNRVSMHRQLKNIGNV
ncbi:GGDEF domain-containing protein [Clostridium oryzae]|uniref:Response regulator PleD n=1 Tax=Clostridium oryzae TaxID=1450648 RepID=A0A1V4IL69_9CLOT|nr:GGDEF domain-containing protein [Clostridium oryzae]OPJ60676.1 response regulator PleD [Clostridium oryzae]